MVGCLLLEYPAQRLTVISFAKYGQKFSKLFIDTNFGIVNDEHGSLVCNHEHTEHASVAMALNGLLNAQLHA